MLVKDSPSMLRQLYIQFLQRWPSALNHRSLVKLHKYFHGCSNPSTHRCQHQCLLVSAKGSVRNSWNSVSSPRHKFAASVCQEGNISGLSGHVPIRSFSCLSTPKSKQNRTSAIPVRSFGCLSPRTQNTLRRHSRSSTLCPPILGNDNFDKRMLSTSYKLKCNSHPYLADLTNQAVISDLSSAVSLQRRLNPLGIFTRNYALFQNNHHDPANPNSQEFNDYLSHLCMEYNIISKRLETDENLGDAERREMRKREMEMRFLVKQIGILDQKKEELKELEMLAKGKVRRVSKLKKKKLKCSHWCRMVHMYCTFCNNSTNLNNN